MRKWRNGEMRRISSGPHYLISFHFRIHFPFHNEFRPRQTPANSGVLDTGVFGTVLKLDSYCITRR